MWVMVKELIYPYFVCYCFKEGR